MTMSVQRAATRDMDPGHFPEHTTERAWLDDHHF